MIVTAVVALVALALPYSPLAGLLGFRPLPVVDLGIILAIVVSYFGAAEAAKRVFYRRYAS